MKKIYTLCLAAALILAASCTKPDNTSPSTRPGNSIQTPHKSDMVSYTISVTKNEPTKVSVADDGSALWEEGDVIRVYNTNEAWQTTGYEATMTSGAGETSATFEFEAPADRNEGFFVTYGAEATLADGKINIVIPSAVETSAKPILAGYTATKDEIGEVDLEAVAAYLKVTLTDDADAVRFFAVNNPNENFAGNIIYEANGSLSTVPSESSVVVSNPSQTFYVNVLPCAYSLGYIIDVEKGGAHMIKSVSYGASKTLPISSFGKIAIPTFAAATVSGTVSPVTTYTNRENDLSKRLKIYGASTSAVAVSGLSEALASHVELAGYACEGETSTDGVFTGDFAIGNHTVTAAYNFHCGGVTIPVGSIEGPAYITGLPYSAVPPTQNNGWTADQGSSKVDWKSGYVSLGDGGTATADPRVKSPDFYSPVADLAVNINTEGTIYTKRVGVSYPCTCTLRLNGNKVKETTSTSTSGNALGTNLDATVELPKGTNNVMYSINGRTALSGYVRISSVEVTYQQQDLFAAIIYLSGGLRVA